MRPSVRKVVLVAHITTSVGWLGAVLAYLVLDITAAISQDVATVRAMYVAMGQVVTLALVPLALVSVLIGLVNSLGTSWGLIRHYWVSVKFLLTVVATVVLLIEAQSVRVKASVALTDADPRALSSSLVHSVGGALILVTILALSVYKPRGVTQYGWRKQSRRLS